MGLATHLLTEEIIKKRKAEREKLGWFTDEKMEAWREKNREHSKKLREAAISKEEAFRLKVERMETRIRLERMRDSLIKNGMDEKLIDRRIKNLR